MTVARFVGIPEWFVKHYNEQLSEWARNMRAINESNAREGLPRNTKRIVLREGVFADVSPNPEMGPVLLQVTLRMRVARAEGPKVTHVEIAPHTEHDAELIRKHVEKMERLRVDPMKRLIEPARAGIPFMPSKLWVPPGATRH